MVPFPPVSCQNPPKVEIKSNKGKKTNTPPCLQMVDSMLFETTIITGQLQSSKPHLSWRLDYLCHQWATLSPDKAFTVKHNWGSRSQTHSCTHTFPSPCVFHCKLDQVMKQNAHSNVFHSVTQDMYRHPDAFLEPEGPLSYRKVSVCPCKIPGKILEAESSSKRKRESN